MQRMHFLLWRLIPTYRPCVQSPQLWLKGGIYVVFPLGVRISAKHCSVEGGGKMRNTELLHHWAALKSFTVKLHCHWKLKLYSPFIMANSVCHSSTFSNQKHTLFCGFLCNEMCRTEGSSSFCWPPAILLNSCCHHFCINLNKINTTVFPMCDESFLILLGTWFSKYKCFIKLH